MPDFESNTAWSFAMKSQNNTVVKFLLLLRVQVVIFSHIFIIWKTGIRIEGGLKNLPGRWRL